MMRKEIKERCLREAGYMIRTGATVRKTAKFFKVSKSTVYKDVSERIILLDSKRAEKVRKVLDTNYRERAIRGGMANKRRYEKMRR